MSNACHPLKRYPNQPFIEGPVVLAIMDGVGIGMADEADAVAKAQTPNMKRYRTSALFKSLQAHGCAVGMPSDGDMGNSEVGHNCMGAGRIIAQGAKRVAQAVADGSLFQSNVFKNLIAKIYPEQRCLHFIGLLSDGNVHSHIDHLLAMLQHCHSLGVKEVRLHLLLDGRDVSKISAHLYIKQLLAVLEPINKQVNRHYLIASGGGRQQITMDRYGADWAMVQRGWQLHVQGKGRAFPSALEAIEQLRREKPGIGDQDLPGFVICKDGKAVGPIEDGDAVILFNFRGDRILELVEAFEDDDFKHFDRIRRPNIHMAGMTLYDGDAQRPQNYLVAPAEIDCTMAELLAQTDLQQIAVSETQKFGHVTYFWNGNRSGMFNPNQEIYLEIPSLPPPFDEHPEMQAQSITEKTLQLIKQYPHSFTRLNFANGDMVGHTGNLKATIEAVSVVDRCLEQLEQQVLAQEGCLIITADHGNAEDMLERDPQTQQLRRDEHGLYLAKTSHSLNPVPLYICLPQKMKPYFSWCPVTKGQSPPGLGNLAATVLHLLGFEAPAMYLPSLLQTNL